MYNIWLTNYVIIIASKEHSHWQQKISSIYDFLFTPCFRVGLTILWSRKPLWIKMKYHFGNTCIFLFHVCLFLQYELSLRNLIVRRDNLSAYKKKKERTANDFLFFKKMYLCSLLFSITNFHINESTHTNKQL